MICPQCHGETIVKDSRPAAHGLVIRRRRLCKVCNIRFTTFETSAEHRGMWTHDQQDRFARMGIALEALLEHWNGLNQTRQLTVSHVRLVEPPEEAA